MVRHFYLTDSGTTTPVLSGPVSNGNEGVLKLQNRNLTIRYCLESYQDTR